MAELLLRNGHNANWASERRRRQVDRGDWSLGEGSGTEVSRGEIYSKFVVGNMRIAGLMKECA